MPVENVTIRIAHWPEDANALHTVRQAVFVEEQKVPAELEWDQLDDKALHILALSADGTAIGTARLLPSGQIGRMAVLSSWRGKQVGTLMLKRILELCDTEAPPPYLNAQQHAAGFYRRFGFRETGYPFEEAGIPHIRMELSGR